MSVGPAVPAGSSSVTLPSNCLVGSNTTVTGELAFKRFHALGPRALVIGSDSTMDCVHFALGPTASVRIGSFCYLSSVVLLAELEVVIGDFVMIGWNATITDSDFHPAAPALRIQDARAISPLRLSDRPPIASRPVVIDDDVWIGPCATILKGAHIGRGAFVEPGAVVTRDVPAGARVLGNPAQEVAR
jgi:acetyltransferase-like isoleucine patch superfamily enzyme